MRVRRFCLIAIATLSGCAEERVPITLAIEGRGPMDPAFTSGTRGQFVEHEVSETPQPLEGAEEAVQTPREGTGATSTDEAPLESSTITTYVIVPAPYPFAPAATAATSAATSAAYGTPPAEEAPREIDPSPEDPAAIEEPAATDEMPPAQSGAPRTP